MKGWLDNYGKEENPNDSKMKGPNLGVSTEGRNYSPAWGGQFQNGGSTGGVNPGSVGFSYARIGAPSNGKHAKKTLPSAAYGDELSKGLTVKETLTNKKQNLALALKKDMYQGKVAVKNAREAKERAEYNKQVQKQGNLATQDEQGFFSKAWDVVTNPMTSAEQMVKYGSVPDYMGKGLESGALARNVMDTPVDFINPVNKVKGTVDAARGLAKGDLTAATMLGVGKLNPLQKTIGKYISKPTTKALATKAVGYGRDKAAEFAMTQGKAAYKNYGRAQDGDELREEEEREPRDYQENSDVTFDPRGLGDFGVAKRGDFSGGIGVGLLPDDRYIRANALFNKGNFSVGGDYRRDAMGNDFRAEASYMTPKGGIEASYERTPTLEDFFHYQLMANKGNFSGGASFDKDPRGITPGANLAYHDRGLRAGVNYRGGENPSVGANVGYNNRRGLDVSAGYNYDGERGSNVNVGARYSFAHGGIIDDDMGQWAHPGEVTRINSNKITMENVDYPVLGISDKGDTKLMQPGQNYKFKGKKVTELPMGKDGNQLTKLDQLTNFTNYNDKQPGGWLDQYEDGGDIKGKVLDERAQATTPKESTGTKTPIMKEVKKEAAPKPVVKLKEEVPKTTKDVINIKMPKVATKEQLSKGKLLVDKVAETAAEKAKEYKSRSSTLDVDKNKIPDIIKPSELKTEQDIKHVQQNLKRLGYNLDPRGKFKNKGVDGKLGDVTMKAIEDHNKKGEDPDYRYTSYKKGDGVLGNCTETHCSEYVQNELFRNMKPSVTRDVWNKTTGLHGDAWRIGRNIESAGGKEVPINKVKQGDVVTIYTGVQTYMKQAKAHGTDATHVGVVDKINADGSYYVLHNTHTGSKEKGYKGKEYRTLVQPDGKLNLKNYAVRKAYEPNYEGIGNYEKRAKVREDVKLVYNPKFDKKLQASDKSITGTDMHKRVSTFLAPINDVRNKKVMAGKHNLSESDYQAVAQVAMGILKQETNLGTTPKAPIKEVGATVVHTLGGKKEPSKGAGRVKFETNYGGGNLSEFGINEKNFSDNDKMPIVVMDIIAKTYKSGIEQGLKKEEALYRAVEKYNKGSYSKYGKAKDSDYVNKVLGFAEGFNPKDKDNITYNTLVDRINLDERVLINKAARKIQ